MFIFSFIIAIVVFLLVLIFFLGIKPLFFISLFSNTYLFGGLPLLILITIFDYILIKSIFRIDKRKNDLPPSMINLRLFSGYIMVFILTYLLIFIDKFFNILLTKGDISVLLTAKYLKHILIHANFLLMFLFFIILYSISFLLKPSKFANFLKNRVFSLLIFVLIIIFSFIYKWEIGSNIIESIISPSIKIKYFEDNINKVNENLKPLFNLRMAEYGVDIAMKNKDKNRIKEIIENIENAMKSDKFKSSPELWTTKLKADILNEDNTGIIKDYSTLFKILKVDVDLLNNFANNLLGMNPPPIKVVYDTLKQYESIVKSNKQLSDLMNFLKENMEDNLSGLEKYYLALNENIMKKKEKLFYEIVNDTFPYKIKDDAYYQYIKLLIKEKRKREALTHLIKFMDKFSNSKYMKKINEIKEAIKYTRIDNSMLKDGEIYCYALPTDDKDIIVSNFTIYEINLDNFEFKKLFTFNDEHNLIVENMLVIDRYFWVFYREGRVDYIKLLDRSARTALQNSGIDYTTPYTTDGKLIYIGTLKGINVYYPSGAKKQIIDKQNDLTDVKIRYLKYNNNRLFIGTSSTIAVFNLKKMNLEIERGYRDPDTHHEYSNFKYVYATKHYLYGIGDLGMIKLNLSTKQWSQPVFRGVVKLVDENERYIAILVKLNGNYKIILFDKKQEKIVKEINDIQLLPPYIILKLTDKNIYLASGSKEILKIALDTYNFTKFKGDIRENSGDILHIGKFEDFLLILQQNNLTFVYLKVK